MHHAPSIGPLRSALLARAAAAALASIGACGAATASTTASSASQSVWIVDDDGGLGTDFIDLQAAVNAAGDGDVLLVKPGLYASFEIAAKGLSIAADIDGTVVCLGTVTVRDLAAGSNVTLRGIRSVPSLGDGFVVEACDGSVWIEACTSTGGPGDGFTGSPSFHPDGRSGVRVVASASVALMRCVVAGGRGADLLVGFSTQGDGGPAIATSGGELALFDCTLEGGDAGSAATGLLAADGGDGGPGLSITAGAVTASGSHFGGGDGGAAGAFDPGIGAVSCGSGGAGGAGIVQPASPDSPVDVRLLACTFSVGSGGGAYDPVSCTNGPLGKATAIAFGSIDGLPGSSFAHAAASPVHVGQPLVFSMSGEPGALAVLGISTDQGLLWDPALGGAVLLERQLMLLFPGFVGLNGTLVAQWNGNVGVPPGSGLVLFAQPVFFVPSTLQPTTGPGSALTVLGAGL